MFLDLPRPIPCWGYPKGCRFIWDISCLFLFLFFLLFAPRLKASRTKRPGICIVLRAQEFVLYCAQEFVLYCAPMNLYCIGCMSTQPPPLGSQSSTCFKLSGLQNLYTEKKKKQQKPIQFCSRDKVLLSFCLNIKP